MKAETTTGLILLFIFSVFIGGSYLGYSLSERKEPEVKIDYIKVFSPLTNWQIFQMALIEVESEFNFDAYRKAANDTGILQITPIYVKECNRLYNTDYQHSDTYNPQKSLEIFALMNPEKDIDIAIKRHNSNAGDWYSRRIYTAMDKIRRQEEIRKILVENE